MSAFIVATDTRISVDRIVYYYGGLDGSTYIRLSSVEVEKRLTETVEEVDALIEEARKKESERKREEKQAEYETVLVWAKKLYEEIYRVEPPATLGAWPIQPMPPNGPSDTEPPQEAK